MGSVLMGVVMFTVVSVLVIAVAFAVVSSMVLVVVFTVSLALVVMLTRVVAPVVDQLGQLAESISHLARTVGGIHSRLGRGRLHVRAHNAGGSGQRDEHYQCDDQSDEWWLHWESPHLRIQPQTGYPYG